MALSEPIDLYCERLDPSFWAEPINAVTNVAFLLAAGMAWRDWREEGPRDPFVFVLILIAFLIGIGSFAFHTLATRGARLLDIIPIALFVHAYLLFALRRFVGLSWALAIGAVAAFFVAARGFSALLPADFLNRSGHYLPVLAALVVVGLVLKRGYAAQQLFVAAGLFAAALVFRIVDREICVHVPVGTHFAWHLLNACVIYVLLRAAVATSAPE